MAPSLRAAHADDAPTLLALAIELGYANDLLEIRERLGRLAALSDHAVLVAEDAGRVVAFMQLRVCHQLESASCAEIAGLVVASDRRGSGIGGHLVAAAEAWARGRGVGLLRVRSNVRRVRTHAFYRKAGFEEAKEQKSFVKRLGAA